MKKNIKKIFITFIIIYLLISELLLNKINFLKYTDEIITIIFGIYIFSKLITSKIIVKKELKNIFYSYITIIIIGILGNLLFKVQPNKLAITLDILSFSKIFICSIGLTIILGKDETQSIINKFYIPSKLFLILATIFGIISLFIDIGMRGEKRFGFYAYNFLYGYEHIFSISVLIAYLFLKNKEIVENQKIGIYKILAIICMILTTKGPSLIWACSILIIENYFKKNSKLNIFIISIFALIIILLGQYQIKTYIQTTDSPRYLLYKYSIINMDKYKPLGSGFATYGSDMASKYYSKLYYDYGFYNRYGMSEEQRWFLNDNYWPMIIGQFGIISTIIYIYIIYNLYKIIINAKIDSRLKGSIVSCVIYLTIHSLGSSTPSTSVAVTLMLVIVLILHNSQGKINE
jgi:oligosaccharide repeat unit polymerase wzy